MRFTDPQRQTFYARQRIAWRRRRPASYSETWRNFEKQMGDLDDFFETARRYKLAKQAKAPI